MKSKRNRYLIASNVSFLMGILFLSGFVLGDNAAANTIAGLMWIFVGIIWFGTYICYVSHPVE